MLVKTTLQDRLGPMFKPMMVMLASVGVVFGALYFFVNFRSTMIKQALASMANPAQTVSVTTAAFQEWRPKLTAIGAFRAVNGADLALEASGIVEKILFQSGEDVVAGQPLLELRKDTDNAKLESLKATAELNAINLRRDQSQLKIHAASQATVDTDLANLKSANAEVAQQEAVIAQKTLRAPFSGRLGIRSVDLGQYLSAGAAIVTLQALDPIFLDFVLPQQALNGVVVGQSVAATVDAFPGQSFAGKITAINSKVDQSSRNVQVRASLANPIASCGPACSPRSRFRPASPNASSPCRRRRSSTRPMAIRCSSPRRAAPPGEERARQARRSSRNRPLCGSARHAAIEVAVIEGLAEGATVVTAGQIKLRNGAPLKIDESAPPPVDADPKPLDQ